MLKILKSVSTILFTLTLLSNLTGCQKTSEDANTITVGSMSGPDEQVLETAKDVAQKQYGLTIKIVQFDDYALPNAALNDGSIDANIFQHKPYLDAAIAANHYKITAVAKTFIFPMGIYSAKIKNISALSNNAIVAVPNDPSNEARALLLLQKAGLIQLKANADVTATPLDILSNPKNLQIKELDAAQLPRTLPDVSIAVINSNYAIPAGLIPTKDAIYLESTDSPYANLIVVRTSDINEPKIAELIAAYHSEPVKQAAGTIFEGQAIPAWK